MNAVEQDSRQDFTCFDLISIILNVPVTLSVQHAYHRSLAGQRLCLQVVDPLKQIIIVV